MEGIPSSWTEGRGTEGGDPLNQSHLKSEWPLSVPRFPLDHSRVLTISDSGDTAQVESPGRPEVPKSSSGFPRGRRCSTAVGLDCLQGRREPGGPWSRYRGLNLPDCRCFYRYRSAGPRHVLGCRRGSPGPLSVLLHPVVAQSPMAYNCDPEPATHEAAHRGAASRAAVVAAAAEAPTA